MSCREFGASPSDSTEQRGVPSGKRVRVSKGGMELARKGEFSKLQAGNKYQKKKKFFGI